MQMFETLDKKTRRFEKYDRFVHVGMAAWVEDHPWNVPDGWPLGSKVSRREGRRQGRKEAAARQRRERRNDD